MPVFQKLESGWLLGEHNGATGMIPATYVKLVSASKMAGMYPVFYFEGGLMNRKDLFLPQNQKTVATKNHLHFPIQLGRLKNRLGLDLELVAKYNLQV